MNFSKKTIFVIAGVFLLLVVLFLAVELQASRRVEAKFYGVIGNVENRKWQKLSKNLSPDYQDRWGFNRKALIENLPEAFRHFLFLEVDPQDVKISFEGNLAKVSAKISIQGRGSALADYIMNRVNSLSQPFVLTFRKESWKPWDWKLISIDQPELVVSDYSSW